MNNQFFSINLKKKKVVTKKSSKSTKTSKKRKPKKQSSDDDGLDSGIVIVDDEFSVDQNSINEERRAYLEEARSQEASEQ